ncbi:MAG: class I SAM-dependent methyltransferase [Actinomycetota bacterium]
MVKTEHEIRTTEGWTPNDATNRIMGRVDPTEFLLDLDWETEIRRFAPLPEIPSYVKSSIHGLEGGYGAPFAAATWDGVVKEIFAEYFGDEAPYREILPAAIDGSPSTVLDVACGTGESTLGWHRRYPHADIIGVDVSPYMLVVAERKTREIDNVDVRAANAEALPFEDGSFEVVTASLLFHELPRDVSPVVLKEMRRVLAPGGWIAVAEPYRVGGAALKPIPFPEPYLKDYLETDWDEAFRAAGFADVRVVEIDNGWMRVARAA